MKLLVGPYGEGNGHGLSFIREHLGPLDREGLASVLADFSCWPPAIPKILSAMEASGRYDCRVVSSVVARGHSLSTILEPFGIRIRFEDTPLVRQIRLPTRDY